MLILSCTSGFKCPVVPLTSNVAVKAIRLAIFLGLLISLAPINSHSSLTFVHHLLNERLFQTKVYRDLYVVGDDESFAVCWMTVI